MRTLLRIWVSALAVFSLAAAARAALPFADDFEAYPAGTFLAGGTNGWHSSADSAVVQTAVVRSGAQAAEIPAETVLSNRMDREPADNVWVQLDWAPSLYAGSNPPAVLTNLACQFYVNSNRHFVVHSGPASPSPSNSTGWIECTAFTLPAGDFAWVQVGVFLDFGAGTWGLSADGGLITNGLAFINPGASNVDLTVHSGGLNPSYLDNVSVQAVPSGRLPLIVTPSALDSELFAGHTPPVHTARVVNIWPAPIGFTAATDRDWVQAAPSGGVVPAQGASDVVLTYAPTSEWAPAVASNGALTVVATNGAGDAWGTQTVSLAVRLMELLPDPAILSNSVVAGDTPVAQEFAVLNGGAAGCAFTATVDDGWLGFPGPSYNGWAPPAGSSMVSVVFANTAGMTAGLHQAAVTLVSTNDGGTTQTVSVSLSVTMALQRAPVLVTPTVMQGQSAESAVQIWTDEPGVAAYTASADQPWLVVEPASGHLAGQTAGATNTLTLTATNTAGLQVGVHTGTVTVAADGCQPVTVEVALTVQAKPMLNADPAIITRQVMQGQGLSDSTIRVWNASADYPLYYEAVLDGGAGWLTLVVTNGVLLPMATNELNLVYAADALVSAGDVPSNHTATLTLTATNEAAGSPFMMPVTVQVNPKPRLALSPTQLNQTVVQGRNAASQGFDLWNGNGYYTLNYTITKSAPWLVPSPRSGTITGQQDRVVVSYSTVNLPPGRTSAVLTVVARAWDGLHEDSAIDATQTVSVALSVNPFATLATDAGPAFAYRVREGTRPPDTLLRIWNAAVPAGGMQFALRSSVPWLTLTPTAGVSTGNVKQVSLRADTSGMRPGRVYRGLVTVYATDAATGQPAYESPLTVPYSLTLFETPGFDFQGSGSGASDLLLYREATGDWLIHNLLTGYRGYYQWGGHGYQGAPGDYDGNGVTDLGLFRWASGSWYAWATGSASVQGLAMREWVGSDYTAAPGDYDGDGRVDPCVYREPAGLWMALLSGSGYQPVAAVLGGPGYAALRAGDYDADGKIDPAVYHRETGLWIGLFSTMNYAAVSGTFGGRGRLAVPADYDGDGITDPAIYETVSGLWYILPSTRVTASGYSLLWPPPQFGGASLSATLTPAPGNYDGMGGADLALYDPTAWKWYITTLDGLPLAWGYPMGSLGFLPITP